MTFVASEMIQVQELIFVGDWPTWWLVIVSIVGLAGVVFGWLKTAQLALPRRIGLAAIRTVLVCLGIALLLQPAIETRQLEKTASDIAVLVDRSSSMGLRADDSTSRLSETTERLDTLSEFAAGDSEDYDFHLFTFSKTPSRSTFEDVSTLQPAGLTNIQGAFETVAPAVSPENLGGAVLFSDGNQTEPKPPQSNTAIPPQLNRRLADLEVPVNTVSAGAREVTDIAIEDITAGSFAFVKNQTTVTAKIRVSGLPPQRVDVELSNAKRRLGRRILQIKPGKTTYELDFEFTPTDVGKTYLKFRVSSLDEEITHRNNAKYVSLEVIRDQIRVLQVAGQPSWDERFLRRFLKKNPNVDLVSFFILRTRDDLQIASTDELSLIPFPTRELFQEKLHTFDLVIFQNFNFGPYQMEKYLTSVRDFVKDGGGFVMLGGDRSFADGGYRQTSIEPLLPGTLPRKDTVDTEPFHPKLTSDGRSHPITKPLHAHSASEAPLERLPKFHGVNRFKRVRGTSDVLAEHPNEETSSGRPMPVISVAKPGDGRSMAVNTDSLWRWGFETAGSGGTPRTYQVFWNRAIRWLIGDPAFRDLKLSTPRNIYRVGDTVEIEAKLSESVEQTDPDRLEGGLKLNHLERFFDAGETSERSRSLAIRQNGTSRVQFRDLEPGLYRVGAHLDGPDDTTFTNKTRFLVVPDNREFRRIPPNIELLGAVAEDTDGISTSLEAFSPDQLHLQKPDIVQVEASEINEIWHHPLAFLVFFILLGFDWSLNFLWGRDD